MGGVQAGGQEWLFSIAGMALLLQHPHSLYSSLTPRWVLEHPASLKKTT